MEPRYLCVGGYVTSGDGQRHYVSGYRLVRLYGLTLSRVVFIGDEEEFDRLWGRTHRLASRPEAVVLRPDESGRYQLPSRRRRRLLDGTWEACEESETWRETRQRQYEEYVRREKPWLNRLRACLGQRTPGIDQEVRIAIDLLRQFRGDKGRWVRVPSEITDFNWRGYATMPMPIPRTGILHRTTS